MAGIRILIELLYVGHNTGSYWIKVYVTNEFLEIRILFTNNRFVPVLK